MAEIKFNATVSSVIKFEKQTGVSLLRAMGEEISITTITELVKALSDATDETIDEYVKEHTFEGLVNALMSALEDSGFLPKGQAPTKNVK